MQHKLTIINFVLCAIICMVILLTAAMMFHQQIIHHDLQGLYIILFLLLMGDFIRTVGNMFMDYPYNESLIECIWQASLKTFGGSLSFQCLLLCNFVIIIGFCNPQMFKFILQSRKCIILLAAIMFMDCFFLLFIEWRKWCSIDHHEKRAHFFYVLIGIFCVHFFITIIACLILFCKKIEQMKQSYKKWVKYVLFSSSGFVVSWFVAVSRRLGLLSRSWQEDHQWFIYLHWIPMILYPIFICIGLYYILKTNNHSFVNNLFQISQITMCIVYILIIQQTDTGKINDDGFDDEIHRQIPLPPMQAEEQTLITVTSMLQSEDQSNIIDFEINKYAQISSQQHGI